MASQTWRIGIQGLKSDDPCSSPDYHLWAYDLVMLLVKIFEIKMGFIRIKWANIYTTWNINKWSYFFKSQSPNSLSIQPISQSYADLLKIPLWSHRSTTSPLTPTACQSPIIPHCRQNQASQVMLVVKNPPANTGRLRDTGLIPESGRSPGGGHGNPLQSSQLENTIDRGAWQAMVHWVTRSWTWLKQLSTHIHPNRLKSKFLRLHLSPSFKQPQTSFQPYFL